MGVWGGCTAEWGVLRVFVVLGRGGGDVGGAGPGLSPCLGAATAWLSVGYLFIIYGMWGSPRTRREQEDSAGAGGTQRVPPGSHQHMLALLVSQRGTWLWQVAAGVGTGLVALGLPVCPLRGHRGGQGSISAGEHPALSPGFPSSPCAAVQPFGSGSPSLGHWGWERRGGGSWGPLGPSWRRTFTFTAI